MLQFQPKSYYVSYIMSTNTPKTLGYCTGIPHIPDELVNDILHRLPVKPLLSFRCVCKTWCSLIDSPTFVKNHLDRNIERNPDSGLILVSCPKRNNFYLGNVDSLNSTAIKVTKPLGSCNGLVCLVRNENDILLWNPATRKCRKLPTTNLRLPSTSFWSSEVGSRYVVGFGYDQLNDDYKVVRISEHTLKGVLDGVMLSVYSLKSNSWTSLRTLSYHICLFRFGTFVDGSLYWVSSYNGHKMIVAFDLAVERFLEVPLPGGVDITTENALLLFVFNRRLCLIDLYSDLRADIWLKNNCGVENSWSKLFPVKKPRILWDSTYWAPLDSFIFHNEIPFEVTDDKFVWFDREKNEFENVTLYGLPAMVDSYVYTESLVALSYDLKSEGKQLFKQSKQKKLNQQMKKKMSKLLFRVFKIKL